MAPLKQPDPASPAQAVPLTEEERLRRDLRDACDVGDVSRCGACGRFGLRPGWICLICGNDPSIGERP